MYRTPACWSRGPGPIGNELGVVFLELMLFDRLAWRDIHIDERPEPTIACA